MSDSRAGEPDRRQGLLRLMAWLSPAFPIGAFSYSSGLEGAIHEGVIASAEGLSDWLAVLLEQGGWRNDAILVCEAHRQCDDGHGLSVLQDLAAALAGSKERFEETMRLGDAFANAAAPWSTVASSSASGPFAYPVAVGAIAGSLGVDLEDTLSAYLHAQIAQAISVAIRLGVIGQSGGVRILAGLEALILDLATGSAALTIDDLGSATLLSDIYSMRHETQYSRLFQS